MSIDPEDGPKTPASFLDGFCGGASGVTAENLEGVLYQACEEGMLEKVTKYIQYRRPDLSHLVDDKFGDNSQTPAQFLEKTCGGPRELAEDQVASVLSQAEQQNIKKLVAAYIRYRRPDLKSAVTASAPGV